MLCAVAAAAVAAAAAAEGLGHVIAIISYLAWLQYITSNKPDRYQLPSPAAAAAAAAVPPAAVTAAAHWARPLHQSCLVAAAAAAAIPMFQLNARLAEQVLPLSTGPIAPHEWLCK
jgi:hypothetical protein